MSEKELLVEDDLLLGKSPRESSPHSRSRWWWVWLLSAGLFATLLLRMHPQSHRWHREKCGNAIPHVRTYPGESVEWTLCGNTEGSDVECSSIDVPMDQFDKQNSSDKMFSIPLYRIRGSKHATKNIIVNPGGPGGSGAGWLYALGKATQKITGDNFHILSFDPRGINGSRPQALCYNNDEVRRSRSIQLAYDPVDDAPRLFPWVGNYVQSCAETLGEFAGYINTPQTAADMNSILDAVGQENMFYWGFSYGSLLGQTYAGLFPNRSERVIIDGVVNQFLWYNEAVEGDFEDSDKVLDGFFHECVKAGGDCPLNVLGNTKEDLERNLTSFLKSLEADPMPVYINNTVHGLLDYKTLWLRAIWPALYNPTSWYTLADNLLQLMKGNGTAALLAYGLDDTISVPREHGEIIHANDGASGKSHWPGQKKEVFKLLEPMFNSSSFAVKQMREFLVKARWPIPKAHQFVPRRGVQTLHPLLVLSTTYDPICPISSAKIARDSFVESRLIEIAGYGHCSSAMASSCLVPHIRAFFNDGMLPDTDIKCEVDDLYFVKPEEKAIPVGGLANEEVEIRVAQRKLAGSWLH